MWHYPENGVAIVLTIELFKINYLSIRRKLKEGRILGEKIFGHLYEEIR